LSSSFREKASFSSLRFALSGFYNLGKKGLAKKASNQDIITKTRGSIKGGCFENIEEQLCTKKTASASLQSVVQSLAGGVDSATIYL
jgi:hypothetical protein